MVAFIGDVHLGLGESGASKQREQDFIDVLVYLQTKCECIVFIGDIFDYWFEYSTVIPRAFYRTLSALSTLRRSGMPVIYLIGNHDFGHKSFFREELGIDINTADVECEFYGKKFYLAHGDGKVHNDTGYLILRSILRNPVSLALFRWLHPDIGIAIASKTSHSSRSYTDTKEYGEQDGLYDFASKKIGEGFDIVVMGHTHSPSQIAIENNGHHGEYINTGDWMKSRTFFTFDGITMQQHSIDDVLRLYRS